MIGLEVVASCAQRSQRLRRLPWPVERRAVEGRRGNELCRRLPGIERGPRGIAVEVNDVARELGRDDRRIERRAEIVEPLEPPIGIDERAALRASAAPRGPASARGPQCGIERMSGEPPRLRSKIALIASASSAAKAFAPAASSTAPVSTSSAAAARSPAIMRSSSSIGTWRARASAPAPALGWS